MRSKLGDKMGASWALCTSQMSLEAAALLKWTVSSNRSFLSPLEDRLKRLFMVLPGQSKDRSLQDASKEAQHS